MSYNISELQTGTGTAAVSAETLLKCTTFTFGENFKLDYEGFHYNGEHIKDAGQAHKLFMEFMEKANNPILTVDANQSLVEEMRQALIELRTAVVFGGITDLPNDAGEGYMARVPDTFITIADAAIAKANTSIKAGDNNESILEK